MKEISKKRKLFNQIISALVILLIIKLAYWVFYWVTATYPAEILEETEFTIAIPDTCSYHSYCISSHYDYRTKQNYLYRLNLNNHQIEVYDLEKKIFNKTIELGYSIDGFFVEAHNEIYVLEYEKNIIHQIDSTGNIKSSWNLNRYINDSIPRVIYSGTEQPLIKYNSLFIFNLVSNVIPPKFYNYETIGIYNTINEELVKTAVFPKSMRDGNIRFGYYPSYSVVNNMLLCSFSADHNLYFYTLDGGIYNKQECKSKYLNNFQKCDISQAANREYNAKFQIEMPTYYTLLYDEYRQLIYRLCLHSQKSVDSKTAMVNDYFDREWSLMVINKDLDILKEIKFPAREYLCQETCITKDGILISKNNENNPNFEPNVLSYKLIKFKDD